MYTDSPDFVAQKPQPMEWDGKQKLAEAEKARYEKLKTYRNTVFKAPWQTLSNYYLPNLSDIDTTKTEGTEGWSDRVFDTTAIEDARTCTTGQSNWATPSAEPWFAWAPPKSLNMDEDDDGAIWCGLCTEIALDELSRSNYYQHSGMQYKSRTVFGTGQMHIEEGRSRLINCSTRKIGTYCIDKNDEGDVDTVYCEYDLTARQAAAKFGPSMLSPKVKKCFEANDSKRLEDKATYVHVIRPREEMERMPGKIDAENKPFASIYFVPDENWCVRVAGYDEMPDSVTSFDDWGTGSVWGYSPAFETLPNVRQLNYIVRFMDAQYELRANPRILAPIHLFGQMDLRPGGITPYDPNKGGELGIPREWMTQADIKSTEDSVAKKQAAVGRMFYTDIFKALQQIKYKATAYEISARLGENLQQLSPMFGRILTEKSAPDLKRIFGLMFRAGKFPKPPRSMFVPVPGSRSKLRLALPEITYTSRLALALKALQNKATTDWMQFVSELATNMNKPELLDNWDLDSMLRTGAINQGMSSRWERPMRQVVQIRQARAKQVAQERAMQMAEQASKSAKNLGGAPAALQDRISDSIPETAAPS